MKNYMKYTDNKRINKLLKNIIELDKQNELEQWLSADEKNRELFDCIKSSNISDVIDKYNEVDSEGLLNKFYSIYGDMQFTETREAKSRTRLLHYRVIASLAAVLVAVVAILYYQGETNTKVPHEIAFGDSKVTLILSSGEQMSLHDSAPVEINDIEGVDIVKVQDGISYSRKGGQEFKSIKQQEAISNTLKTGVGGSYKLTLSDGSEVWLNSNSSLHYPVTFSNNQRVVHLVGEAFFDVKRDEKRPFIVKTSNELEIKVLGTSFNVNAYSEKKDVSTVLVDGKVALNHNNNTTVLEPGKLGLFSAESGKVEVRSVDTNIYTSWKEGEFVFENETIETIINRLRLWYEFNVKYENERIKEARFSGSIKRRDDISLFMEVIELSGGVKFELDGNIVIVKEQANN